LSPVVYDLGWYSVDCNDCPPVTEENKHPGDLSEGGNNLTRREATAAIRKHHRETGHASYTVSAMGGGTVTA